MAACSSVTPYTPRAAATPRADGSIPVASQPAARAAATKRPRPAPASSSRPGGRIARCSSARRRRSNAASTGAASRAPRGATGAYAPLSCEPAGAAVTAVPQRAQRRSATGACGGSAAGAQRHGASGPPQAGHASGAIELKVVRGPGILARASDAEWLRPAAI